MNAIVDKKERDRLRAAEYRARNPDKVREINRRARLKKMESSPESIRAYQKRYRDKNRQALSDAERERKFGITRQEYADLYLAQNGVCAICCQPETATRNGKIKALAVDHCHTTGTVRGLLCAECNIGIGKLRDDRNVLLNAIKYLDKYSKQPSNVVTIAAKE